MPSTGLQLVAAVWIIIMVSIAGWRIWVHRKKRIHTPVVLGIRQSSGLGTAQLQGGGSRILSAAASADTRQMLELRQRWVKLMEDLDRQPIPAENKAKLKHEFQVRIAEIDARAGA